jgi:hypothetical protein
MMAEAPPAPQSSVPRSPIALIRTNLRAYVTLNAVYYGLILIGAVAAALFPNSQQNLVANTSAGLNSGPLSWLTNAYTSGNFTLAALGTFGVNLVGGAFGTLTLPSAIIPFSGVLAGCVRASMWGMTLAPTTPKMMLAMIPHSITMLLEGQAYVLAMFGSYLWATWLFHPDRAGASTAGQAYRAGARANLQLYKLIVPLLALSAAYEALEVITVTFLLRK